jgi:hypothetical protein
MSAVQDATSRDQRTFASRSGWFVAIALTVAVALVVVGAVSALTDGTLYWVLMPALVAVMMLYCLRSLRTWYGRTEVDRKAITAVAGGNRVVFPWSEVAAIEVSPPSLLGRVVGLRTRDARRAKALPAPSVGVFGSRRRFATDVAQLVAMAPDGVEISDHGGATVAGRRRLVLLRTVGVWFFGVLVVLAIAMGWLVLWATQPWSSPQWPGRLEASITPQACAVDQALVRRLVAGATDGQPDETSTSSVSDTTACTWVSSEGQASNRSLSLTVTRQLWTGRSSATDEAVDMVTAFRGEPFIEAPFEAVAGVGDEAWVADALDSAAVNPGLRIIARRANVWVDLVYHSDSSGLGADPERYRTAAIDVARTALGAVQLD